MSMKPEASRAPGTLTTQTPLPWPLVSLAFKVNGAVKVSGDMAFQSVECGGKEMRPIHEHTLGPHEVQSAPSQYRGADLGTSQAQDADRRHRGFESPQKGRRWAALLQAGQARTVDVATRGAEH